MELRKIRVAVIGVALIALNFRAWGWAGVAVATSGIVLWALLGFTRATAVLQRAAKQPIGWVASAVMLNAKLKPGATLLHVIALTRALGELKSPKDEQPEIYCWTDNGGSNVTCEFADGKLVLWELVRPAEAQGGKAPAAQPDPAQAEVGSAPAGP